MWDLNPTCHYIQRRVMGPLTLTSSLTHNIKICIMIGTPNAIWTRDPLIMVVTERITRPSPIIIDSHIRLFFCWTKWRKWDALPTELWGYWRYRSGGIWTPAAFASGPKPDPIPSYGLHSVNHIFFLWLCCNRSSNGISNYQPSGILSSLTFHHFIFNVAVSYIKEYPS